MVDRPVRGSELAIANETTRFDAPIAQYIELDEFVVVRLEMTGDAYTNHLRNILGVTRDGTVRWKLPKRPDHEPRPYTNVYTDEDGLWASNFSGNKYQIDPRTGSIIDERFVKEGPGRRASCRK